MKKLALAALMAALAGCAAQQQTTRVSSADDPTSFCLNTIENDPQFAPLKRHLMLSRPEAATLEMLTDTGKPVEEERQALSLWAKRRSMCTEAGRPFRAQHFPALVATFENVQVSLLQLIADLYAGRKSYGEFNVARQQLGQQARAQFAEIERQQRSDFASRQAAQQAANAQAAQTMLLLQAMQPRPVAMPISPTVNCSSFRSGNVTNTSCN